MHARPPTVANDNFVEGSDSALAEVALLRFITALAQCDEAEDYAVATTRTDPVDRSGG